ncbi:hypothetical protein [Luteibacter sp. UNCMF366Tsu5.1]|uniref:hypothetical protein n=1 Tax=Luteibacter sp. UNCMF366Tsu5.1 TaxID=1502758 RepID=UPI000908651C|nr:hypothetical protein [Luteibacter sp. UNCMF366Tsu5.1]SFW74501.1 hypothetical protein SAMN02800691_3439 [Luteibacter sp. UNCMF366Tsu5.1]
MPKHINSASRLFAISEKIAAAKDDAPTLEVWGNIFGLPNEPTSAVEVCRRLIWINEEIDAMVAQMRATHFSEHLYLKPAKGMRNASAPTAIGGQARSIKGACSEPVRNGLEYCAEALPNEEERVSPESIKALENLVAELKALVAQADIPDHLRHLVQRHIDLLQAALDALPIKGVKSLIEAALAASGQLGYLAAEDADKTTDADPEIREKVLGMLKRTWTTVGKTIDVAAKTQKALALGYAAYKAVEVILQ